MSTPMSTQSGITLVFIRDCPPPPMVLHENVVCVHAWRCAPGRRRVAVARESRRSAPRRAAPLGRPRRGRASRPCVGPQLVEPRRRAVLADALDDRGRRHQRVVGLERRRAVARRAAHAQTPPGHALLADVDGDVRLLLRAAVQAAVLGQHVVGRESRRVRGRPSTASRGRCPTPRRRRRSRSGRRVGRNPVAARCRKATAIDAVRLSMSTAPLPHTSPSTSSPPNGIARPAALVDRHDVGVAHQAQARRRRVAALDAGDQRGAARASARSARRRARSRRGTTRAASALRDLEARLGSAVVDAAIADHLLQQLDGLAGEDLRAQRSHHLCCSVLVPS